MLATVSLVGDTLLITDESVGGLDDNLTISTDVFDRYVIEDPDQTMFTSVPGASGDGSNSITLSSLTTVNSITFSTAGGNDSILVENVADDVLAGDLTILGGAGSDFVEIFADIEFAADSNLNVDLTNGSLLDDADQISLSSSPNFVFSGSGAARLFANSNVSFDGGTATIDVVDGDIDIRANEGRVNFHSLDTGQAINNNTVTVSDLVIADSDTIIDLNVTLDIDHTNTPDLDVFLIHPDGTRVELFTDVGGVGNNFETTSLDDEAFSSVAGSVAPHTGVFRPEGDLSVLDGKSTDGTWQLEITDDSFLNDGTLNAWSLNLLTDNPVSYVGETGGVKLAFSDLTTTGTGDINVFGRGGSGTGSQLQGVWMDTIDLVSTSTATDAGEVNIEGVGGTGTRNNWGVLYSQGRVDSESGDVFIRGVGGGQTNQNWGVFLLNMNVQTSGDATIVATGGAQSHGYTAGQSSVRANGNTIITGIADEGQSGIRVFSSSSPISGDTDLILEADDIGLAGGFVPDSDGLITFRPLTQGYDIDLGSNPSGALGLEDSEIDTIFLSEAVQIGDENSGDIVVSDRISTRHNMSLVTPGSITFNDQIVLTSEKWLNLNAGMGVFPAFNGVDVSIGEQTLGFASGTDLNVAIDGQNVDAEYDQLNVVGEVNLSGADLIVDGSYTPVIGDQFVIVNNDETDSIVGRFNGVPEGHQFENFLGSEFTGEASYVGGDGNDFVITVLAQAKVASVVLGDGTAQRSRVDQLQVTFNALVDFTNNDPLFALTMFQFGENANTEVDLVLDSIDESSGVTVLNLSFTGALTRGGGALLDGNYELNVRGADYTYRGTSVAGQDFSIGNNSDGDDKFFSLFGDSNGDRTINIFDLLQFRNVYNNPDNYNRIFDFSDDGIINIFDLLQFRSRYRTSI